MVVLRKRRDVVRREAHNRFAVEQQVEFGFLIFGIVI